MGGQLSRQNALPGCDWWIEELAWSVILSHHGVEIGAIAADWTLQRETLWLATTGPQEHPSGGASGHKPLEAPQLAPPGDLLDDRPAPDSPVRRTSQSRKVTLKCWENSAELQQWPSLGVSYRGTPQPGQRACLVSLSVPNSVGRVPQRLRQE